MCKIFYFVLSAVQKWKIGEVEMIFVNGHKVSQVICLSCFRRWIAARPIDTRLDELECPDCHQHGIAIETGETSVAEELLKQIKEQEADKKDVEYMPMEVVPVTIGNDYRTWLCSACGSKLQYGKELICPKCHRKIDWEGR